MTEHTPGPWTALGGSPSIEIAHCGEGADHNIVTPIARIDNSTNREANARLIAAAPDLLAACKTITARDEAITGETPWCGLCQKPMDDCTCPGRTIRAAIAKATK